MRKILIVSIILIFFSFGCILNNDKTEEKEKIKEDTGKGYLILNESNINPIYNIKIPSFGIHGVTYVDEDSFIYTEDNKIIKIQEAGKIVWTTEIDIERTLLNQILNKGIIAGDNYINVGDEAIVIADIKKEN